MDLQPENALSFISVTFLPIYLSSDEQFSKAQAPTSVIYIEKDAYLNFEQPENTRSGIIPSTIAVIDSNEEQFSKSDEDKLFSFGKLTDANKLQFLNELLPIVSTFGESNDFKELQPTI